MQISQKLLKKERLNFSIPATNLHMNRYALFFKGCCFKNTIVDRYSVVAPRETQRRGVNRSTDRRIW